VTIDTKHDARVGQTVRWGPGADESKRLGTGAVAASVYTDPARYALERDRLPRFDAEAAGANGLEFENELEVVEERARVAAVAHGTVRHQTLLNGDGVEVWAGYVFVALGNAHLGKQDHRALVALCPVQRVDRSGEALGDRAGCDHGQANVAVARAQRLEQV